MKQNRLKQLFYDNCDKKITIKEKEGKRRGKKRHVWHCPQWIASVILVHGVFILVQGVFVSVHGVFVLVHGVFVLVHGVLGLRSLFFGLRFRNTLSKLAVPVSKLAYAT